MNYAPPIQAGIFMVQEDGHFEIAVSIRNPTDEHIGMRTMDGKLFHVSMKERTMTEEGTVNLWSPQTGATQAVEHWTLDPNDKATRHWTVPNKKLAMQKAREWLEEGLLRLDEDEREYLLSDDGDEELSALVEDEPAFNYVEPSDVGIVQVTSTLPSGSDYFNKLTRQFDLRTRPERALDESLPKAEDLR